MAFHTFEGQPEWIDKDLPISPYEECDHSHCVKINDYEKHMNVHHCSKFQHCILGMDHFSTLTNNAVGRGTIKAFTLLMFYFNCLTIVGFYVSWSYINENDLWYFQDTRLDGKMLPTLDRLSTLVFFPVGSHKGSW